eukprot:3162127-Rhodomonas_salina.2
MRFCSAARAPEVQQKEACGSSTPAVFRSASETASSAHQTENLVCIGEAGRRVGRSLPED